MPAPFFESPGPSGPFSLSPRISPAGPETPRPAFFTGTSFDNWVGKLYTNWANGRGEESQ